MAGFAAVLRGDASFVHQFDSYTSLVRARRGAAKRGRCPPECESEWQRHGRVGSGQRPMKKEGASPPLSQHEAA
jgi:hypothetical protein